MSDPYRDATPGCPTCAGPLHEVEKRLVCDAGHGMLIALDDLAVSFFEVDGATQAIEARDVKPAEGSRCPRCAQPMQSCTLHTPAIRLDGRFLRCEQDGVWVPSDALVSGFARASRKAHVSRVERFAGNTMTAQMDLSRGGLAGAMAGIREAFRSNASSALAISHWRERAPRVHSVFVSAFRGRNLNCPRCTESALEFAGERWICKGCAGCFVEDAALAGLVGDMTGSPWELPAAEGAAGDRRCPVCTQAMRTERLEPAAIDRCHGHGVWFDEEELAQVLEQAAQPRPVAGWLKRLFHRA